jgi:hypothetical protein
VIITSTLGIGAISYVGNVSYDIRFFLHVLDTMVSLLKDVWHQRNNDKVQTFMSITFYVASQASQN